MVDGSTPPHGSDGSAGDRRRPQAAALACPARIATMPRSVIALSVALSLLLAADAAPSRAAQRAAARQARPAPSAAAEPAEDPGELLVRAKCAKCHGLERTTGSVLTEAGWRAHMKKMGRLPGAAITDEQASRIRAYLLQRAAKP